MRKANLKASKPDKKNILKSLLTIGSKSKIGEDSTVERQSTFFGKSGLNFAENNNDDKFMKMD